MKSLLQFDLRRLKKYTPVVCAVGVAFILVAVLTIFNTRAQAARVFEARADLVSDWMSRLGSGFLREKNQAEMRKLIEIAEADPQLSFAVFLDANGEIVSPNSRAVSETDGLLVFTKHIATDPTLGSIRVAYKASMPLHGFVLNLSTTGLALVLSILIVGGVIQLVFRRRANLIEEAAETLCVSSIFLGRTAVSIEQTLGTLAERSQEQATSFNSTIAALRELSQSVGLTVDATGKTTEVVQSCQASVKTGKSSVQQLAGALGFIAQNNDHMGKSFENHIARMDEFLKIISEIEKKTGIINEIVFQTKLLSFNASVEAARAGEHGRGFTVVAQEIGALASVSGSASKEITALLNQSSSRVKEIADHTTNEIRSLMQTGKSTVETSEATLKECIDAFTKITKDVSSSKSLSNEISQATLQQRKYLEELTGTVNQLEQLMTKSLEASNESRAASQCLSIQAGSMKGATETLQGLLASGGPDPAKKAA